MCCWLFLKTVSFYDASSESQPPGHTGHTVTAVIALSKISGHVLRVEQVVRVKNRLDPAHDSAESGGYRDVAVRCTSRIIGSYSLN
jgi:hypothetical protein